MRASDELVVAVVRSTKEEGKRNIVSLLLSRDAFKLWPIACNKAGELVDDLLHGRCQRDEQDEGERKQATNQVAPCLSLNSSTYSFKPTARGDQRAHFSLAQGEWRLCTRT